VKVLGNGSTDNRTRFVRLWSVAAEHHANTSQRVLSHKSLHRT
jgi:hypothetical protein